jgi:hypothetical protein
MTLAKLGLILNALGGARVTIAGYKGASPLDSVDQSCGLVSSDTGSDG